MAKSMFNEVEYSSKKFVKYVSHLKEIPFYFFFLRKVFVLIAHQTNITLNVHTSIRLCILKKIYFCVFLTEKR